MTKNNHSPFDRHVGQLQSIVSLLLDNRPQQALAAWNTLNLQPELVDIRLPGGDQVVLVAKGGAPATLKLDDIIRELQGMLDGRADSA